MKQTVKLNKCKHCLCNINQGTSWCELNIPMFPDHCDFCKEFEYDIYTIDTVTGMTIQYGEKKNEKDNL